MVMFGARPACSKLEGWMKARALWLERRAMGQAGFTELQELLAPDSGRTTGRCTPSP
ncbi:Hypothetical predicted protein [Olea europaea subsp. europaea]|uniref:Uncharacterized protein n=1 Tax=Olea europaea subsp. europaea TaxID=158383 RepID=A0A8S0U7B8_OLEEU|nr:Hypothetical predicted protein [Olea europaea subsp. europaea]